MAQREAPAGPVAQEARVIDANQQRVTLEIDGTRRTVSYGQLGPGRVQVEFGRLADEDEPDDELAGSASFDGLDESAGGPDEEGPDGH